MKKPVFDKELINSLSKKEINEYIDHNPQLFNELFQIAVSDNEDYAWKAAWLLNNYIKNKDKRILKYTNLIIDSINFKKDGHQRELLKILQKVELNDEQEGRLFNICIMLWENVSKQSSVRYTAFSFILKTAQKYPELLNEIIFLTETRYIESLSEGIKRSVLKMTHSFNSNHKLN